MADGPAPSAHGLFRAYGHAPTVEAPREADDFYPTPPEPTRAFLAAEGAALRGRFPRVWEPAAGDGAMVRELEAEGFTVIASDLVDRGCGAQLRDFFAWDRAPAPALITNPPFCLVNWRDGKGRWIRHALEALDVEYMALLLPWSWPGAGGLGPLWSEWPPARVYLMRWKIDFTGAGSPPQLNAWFVWDRAARIQDDVALRMLDRADPRQSCFDMNTDRPALSRPGAAASPCAAMGEAELSAASPLPDFCTRAEGI